MEQQVVCYESETNNSTTYETQATNYILALQGVDDLNLDCEHCIQHFSHRPGLQFSDSVQMHVSGKNDFIPLKSQSKSPLCKKKGFVNADGSHHGGKKRRENGDTHQSAAAPWIMRNYSQGCHPVVGLHEEIEDFYNYMRPTDEERCMREHVIQLVKDIVLKLWRNAKVDVFGSFRTNLYLPTSDIDIVLFGKWEHLPLWTLKEELVSGKIAEESSVKVLDRAAVPIIKFQHIDTGVKVDICFNMVSGVESVKVVQAFLQEYPSLPKLVFVLKQFLFMRDLNEVWTGGLSSYSLLLLCVSFLQHHPRRDARTPNTNIGVLLLEFFELYGLRFTYESTSISVTNGGSYISKSEFRQQIDSGSAPSLLSIVDPLNKGNDLGRGSYQMIRVKQAFSHAYHLLTRAIAHHKSNGHYQPTSYLRLIIEVSETTIEHRQRANKRWRCYISAPTDSFNEVHRNCQSTGSSACSIESSCDASITCPVTLSEGFSSPESDFDEDAETSQPRTHEFAHREEPFDALSANQSPRRKIITISSKKPPRTVEHKNLVKRCSVAASSEEFVVNGCFNEPEPSIHSRKMEVFHKSRSTKNCTADDRTESAVQGLTKENSVSCVADKTKKPSRNQSLGRGRPTVARTHGTCNRKITSSGRRAESNCNMVR